MPILGKAAERQVSLGKIRFEQRKPRNQPIQYAFAPQYMRKGEQKREKTVAFVKTQAIRQKRLIVEHPIVERVIVCADVAHIHSG